LRGMSRRLDKVEGAFPPPQEPETFEDRAKRVWTAWTARVAHYENKEVGDVRREVPFDDNFFQMYKQSRIRTGLDKEK